jgi:predicted DCC family thiol-disulfide oxidoreductase YuxK
MAGGPEEDEDMAGVFLYDGDCAFCTRCAVFLRRHVFTPVRVAAWQSVDLTPLGVTAEEAASAVQYIGVGRVSAGPVAIADLLRTASSRWWRLGGAVLGLRPVLWLAWPVYRLISANRHRLPGGTVACELPRATRA